MNPTPQIPVNAPFNEAQRLWLNGYIAGIISQANSESNPSESSKNKIKQRIPIVFASQSGNSQSLAEQFGDELEKSGFETPVFGAEEYENFDLTKEEFLLIISSTWGDGDPPDNAVDFWNHINSENHPRLEKLQYSVLGLGDKNYLHFCAMGEKFDKRLEELGAKRLTPRGECDVDYEETAEDWFNGVLKNLDTSIKKETTKANTDGYSKKNPFPAKVILNKNLNEQESQKQTHHVEFDLSGSNLSYEAGDVLGIYPTNDPELINELITNLNFDPDELVDDKKLKETLLNDYDIRNLTKDFVLAWFDKSSSEALGQIINNSSLEEYVAGREIIDLVVDYPVSFSEPKQFLSLLRKLSPRLYSISSSPNANIDEVHITVAKVSYESHGRSRNGVCSAYLADRCNKNDTANVFLQSSKHFKLPQDSSIPIIMVGPGTGIAPFRAFLQEREFLKPFGKNWLFFGNPHEGTDFLYKQELMAFKNKGILSKLSTAWSRDQENKIYVQDVMAQEGKEIWNWLNEGAYFYVCGDAKYMAKDVDSCLHKIIDEHGKINSESYIKEMKKEKRYQRDVY